MKICHVLRVYQHRRRHLVLALTRRLGKSSEKFHASRSASSCLTLHTAIFQTLPFRSFLQICPPSRFLPGPSWWYYLSGPPRGLSLVVLCGLWLAVALALLVVSLWPFLVVSGWPFLVVSGWPFPVVSGWPFLVDLPWPLSMTPP
jgi:hypothetical protein